MDNSIPALERTFDLLESVYARPDGITAAELAEQTGIPRTTLYRILRILSARGYLAPVDGNGTYVLGQALARMASGVKKQDDLLAAARPAMRVLSEQAGETVKLVLREGMESFTIAVHVPFDNRVASQVGARIPLHIGASQRLLLSRAPERVRAHVLSRPLVKWGPGTITSASALRESLALLADRDWAFGQDEGIAGVATFGALIHEGGHDVRAAIAVVFITEGKTERDLARFKSAVREAARALSAALG
jgi:IclR family acetate operon transcriptional repressor